MDHSVGYELADCVATISIDDGKLNVLSLEMFAQLGAALDRARSDRAAVLLTGREGVFSAGFDLTILRGGGAAAQRTVRAGFELARRILEFPAPVVVACTGHAVAMGMFLVLAGDYRLGALGPYKIGANEVAIGIAVPRFAIELCRQRMLPAHFQRALILSETYDPQAAVVAGILDRAVPPNELAPQARALAVQAATLDFGVLATTKRRARQGALDALAIALAADADGDQTQVRA